VNFIAAIVLYFLAVGGVRGFAFTLGLTTLIDLIVVFFFTHPVMRLLARTKFFGQGHKLSGFHHSSLGLDKPRYVGRGRVSTPGKPAEAKFNPDGTRMTIAQRKAAEKAASQLAPTSEVNATSKDGEL
jgi:preprotein translocase subunit SecD